jgi:hypothetical protein
MEKQLAKEIVEELFDVYTFEKLTRHDIEQIIGAHLKAWFEEQSQKEKCSCDLELS